MDKTSIDYQKLRQQIDANLVLKNLYEKIILRQSRIKKALAFMQYLDRCVAVPSVVFINDFAPVDTMEDLKNLEFSNLPVTIKQKLIDLIYELMVLDNNAIIETEQKIKEKLNHV